MEHAKLRTILTIAAVAALVIVASATAAIILTTEDESPLDAHDPIHIQYDAGFIESQGVTGGDGTPSNPYVIEGWRIVLDASSDVRSAVTLYGTDAHVVIRDIELLFQGNMTVPSTTGILLEDASNCTIQNVTFVNLWYGVHVMLYSFDLIVENLQVASNTFRDCSTAVYVDSPGSEHLLWDGDLSISDNRFTGVGMCVNAGHMSGIDFQDNVVADASEGLVYLRWCRDCTVTGNALNGDGESAVRITDSSRIEVSDNSWMFGHTGVRVSGSDNVTVERNNMTSVSVGILVLDSQDVVARFNQLAPYGWPGEDLVGIWLESSLRVDASNNSIHYYRVGVLVVDCEDCTLLDNFYSCAIDQIVETTTSP